MSGPPRRALVLAANQKTDTPAGRANADNDNPNIPSVPPAAAHTRGMLQTTELPSGTGGDTNAPTPSPAADNAAAASGDGTGAGTIRGNAPSSSPSPAATAAIGGNEPSPSPAAAAAAGGGNAPSFSPSPAALANNTTAAGDGGAAAGGGANAVPPAAAGGGAFPGYPRSGGLLSPQLSSLLVAIQEARLYNDSKTAVDLVLKGSVEETAAAYQQLLSSAGASSGGAASGDAANTTAGAAGSSNGTSGGVSPDALRQFVNETMQPAGSDLLTCQAADWTPDPPGFLSNLQQQQGANSSGTDDAAAASGVDNSSSIGTNTTANATELLQFGRDLHQLWGLLCRQVSPDVSSNPERHSLLPLTEPTIVPGDRFRETYYWDSYWVIRGLLASGMTQSARNLVSNLLSMLEAVGHVPNGARVYYINRSQPPLLSAMVREVYEAQQQTADSSTDNSTDNSVNSTGANSSSNGTQLLSRALPPLLREHEYWTTGDKAVTVVAADGSRHNLSRYWANWTAPRPESYREDAELAANVTGSASADGSSSPAAAALYRDLASGAESGWDYSSRWFEDGRTMATIRTTQIIPADLNAFLYQLETNIAWAAELLGQEGTSQAFSRLAAGRRDSINKLLWDNQAGMWRDGVLQQQNSSSSSTAADAANSTDSSGTANATGAGGSSSSDRVYTLTQNPGVFASNFVPLWAGVAAGDVLQGSRVVEALQGSGLVQPAGIATTLYNTGQQWDWPNGWPPLQHMLVQGARQYGGATGQEFACSMARTWLGVNLAVYKQTGHMHEKYDVTKPQGDIGGGGEYAPQVGFGWSNGVALDFLANYC